MIRYESENFFEGEQVNHQFKAATLLAAVFLNANIAHASLDALGNGLVYDSVANVTWSSDGNLFGTMLTEDPSLVSKIIEAAPVDTSNSEVHRLNEADFGIGSDTPGAMSLFGATAWVKYLDSTDYLGHNTWALPTVSQQEEFFYTELGGKAGQSITETHNSSYSLFRNVEHGGYWAGSEYAPTSFDSGSMSVSGGNQGEDGSSGGSYSWAELPGNVSMMAPVPEPGEWALMLAGFALIGFIVRRRNWS